MSQTALVLACVVSVLLLIGVVVLLYRDGLFTDAKDWLADDEPPIWFVETNDKREPVQVHLAAPRAQTKGFTRNAKVVPMRPSVLPRRATK